MAKATKKSVSSGKWELMSASFFALVALATVLYVRWRLLGMPFERDEGEYAYSGWLILEGLPPYLHAYTMKLPGMAYLNALFMVCFGKSITAVRLGLLLANLLSAALLCSITRKIFGTAAGLFAAALFLLMAISQHLLGAFAHATHFMIPFILAAMLCILQNTKPLSQYRFLCSGLLLGGAFLIKQHAVFFLLSAMLSVLINTRPVRAAAGNLMVMLFGFLLPYLTLLLVILHQGAFAKFWFWTVSYASSYASGLTPLLGWINFRAQMSEIFASMLPYWTLALAGLIIVFVRHNRRELAFILPLVAAAFLAICPGFHFRPHYFILVAPVVALLAGAVSGDFLPKPLRMLFVVALFAAASFQLWNERWFLFSALPQEYLKQAYQTTKPFAEDLVVADYLAKQTGKSDRILVLGSEPQIYFYSGRISATGYIYMYPLVEDQPYAERMQQEMLQELATAKPEFLVLVDDLSSWLAVTESGEKFRDRLNDMVMRDYELDGVARISRENESFYVFGERARQFFSGAGSRILLYRLKK